jgi:acetolactate synthase-1/2/3 large subunit
MRVADYIVNRLSAEGVRHIFAVSGRGALFLTDAVARNSDAEYVATHHEQAAGFAAVAYAQYNSNLGACIVSTGCASTNAITAVLSAWQDGIPVVFISGQNSLNETTNYTKIPIRTYGQQEADIVELVKSITKYSTMVTDPADIGGIMDTAIHEATTGRKGPVWIDVPLDIQSRQVDIGMFENESGNIESTETPSLSKELALIIDALRQAERPILLIGSGIHSSGVKDLFAELVHRDPIPVVFSGSAVDVYGTTNRWSIGSVGMMGCSRAGNFAIQNADLIIVLGNRLSSMTTGTEFSTFARQARVIIVDIDPIEHTKKSIKFETVIQADLTRFIPELLLHDLPRTNAAWLHKCEHWKDLFSQIEPHFSNSDEVDLYELSAAFSEVLPEESSLVCDSGLIELILPTNISFRAGSRCIHPVSQGAMGYALPAAVGVQLASQRLVVVVVGDGSIMMNLQELQTISHLGLPIKIFVVNNNAYAIIRKRQNELFRGRTIGTDESNGVSCPSFEEIAKAFSFAYTQITESNGLSGQLKTVFDIPGPVICEITGDPNQDYIQTSQVQNSRKRFIRRPLEDQHPFLERNLFNSEMIIPPLREDN